MEIETQYVRNFARLVEICKEYNVFAMWDEHVRITELVDFDLPQVDINWVIKAAKRHTSFQCKVIVLQLTGIMDLGATVRLNTGDNGNKGGQENLLHYAQALSNKGWGVASFCGGSPAPN